MATTWTINVQVNTRYLYNLPESGSWENPTGGGQYFKDNVRMTAVNSEDGGKVYIGDGDSFSLNVGADDEIQWVVTEINPLFRNRRSVCMYGFAKGDNWDANLTNPSATAQQEGFVSMLHGFNAPSEPTGLYLHASEADVSVPTTTVKARAQSGPVTYYMKLLLVNMQNLNKPEVLKYIQIDPVINIVL